MNRFRCSIRSLEMYGSILVIFIVQHLHLLSIKYLGTYGFVTSVIYLNGRLKIKIETDVLANLYSYRQGAENV